MPSKDKRKLAAIMFADVVGYSRMMANNEERTLELLRDFENICSPIISKYEGEIIKKVGDELFCEFSSAKQAVDSALAIQDAIQPYNDSRPKDFKLHVRIGIHVGDIVLRDGDVFGDGVNVASRIQSFANPGGICVSNAVRDAISSHPNYTIKSEGQQELKNILEKHTLYKVVTGYEQKTKIKKGKISIAVIIGILVVCITCILFFSDSLIFWEEAPPDHSKVYDSFLVNIKSTQQYIDNYKKTPAYDEVSTYVDTIYPITNRRLTEIQDYVYAKLRQEFIHHDLNINFAENKEEKKMLNKMVSWAYVTHLINLEVSLKEKKYANNIKPLYFETIDYFNKKYKTHIDWVLSIDVAESIPSLKTKILGWDTQENTTVVGFEYVGTKDYIKDNGDRSFIWVYESIDISHIEDDDIKEPIFEFLSNTIKDFSFGDHIGHINSILDTDFVTIKLNKPDLIRGTQLICLYKGYIFKEEDIESTLRAYTDDYKTIYNYFTQHPESIDKLYTELNLDSLDYGGKSNLLNWYKIEIDSLEENYQNIVNDYQNQKFREVNGLKNAEFRYYLKILTVQDSIATAKVTGKLFPFTQPQVGDKINLK